MSVPGASGNSGEECEGEDAEDSSSLSLANLSLQSNENQEQPVEDELASFRQRWRRELESPRRQVDRNNSNTDQQPESIEEQARELFARGADSERRGALDEAVHCYRRALQLVPDIELRLREMNAQIYDVQESSSDEEIEDTALREENEEENDDEDNECDIIEKIQKIIAREGVICKPKVDPKGLHLSDLPFEVILLILRWVVGGELDAVSLCRCGAVCRGLYLASSDPEIWRSICARTWGHNCGTLKGTPWSSWRHMYIERTRLRFHGCYISKTSYLRHGENSFQDTFYKPWYLVQYYRYLRFFPDGSVLMLTTADEPSACVAHLRQRSVRSDQPILSGHYRLVGDKVLIVVKKHSGEKKPAQTTNTRFRPRRNQTLDQTQQTFHLELTVCAHKSRRNAQLTWSGYKVTTRNKIGHETTNSFELAGPRYPPFWFSLVRSYSAQSEAPLV